MELNVKDYDASRISITEREMISMDYDYGGDDEYSKLMSTIIKTAKALINVNLKESEEKRIKEEKKTKYISVSVLGIIFLIIFGLLIFLIVWNIDNGKQSWLTEDLERRLEILEKLEALDRPPGTTETRSCSKHFPDGSSKYVTLTRTWDKESGNCYLSKLITESDPPLSKPGEWQDPGYKNNYFCDSLGNCDAHGGIEKRRRRSTGSSIIGQCSDWSKILDCNSLDSELNSFPYPVFPY